MRAVRSHAGIGVAVVASALLLAGCGDDAGSSADTASGSGLTITAEDDGFHGTLIEPAQPRPDLELRTTSGDLFNVSDRPDDEVTVLFLGYTHCPDVCPTTMADLSLAYDMLDADVRSRSRSSS